MALINSLAGITEISDNLYEVTSVVNIGSGIDDISDSTFIMKNGGLLKWTSGCTTTFTNCVFHETDTALALGGDNFLSYNPGYPPRFNSATTPVFQGCQWIVNTSSRSDFDTTIDAAPTFEKDSKGQKCRIIVRNDFGLQFNHLTSDNMTIDGLIIDQDGGGAAAEFARIPADATQWNDLEIINYDGTDIARHVTFLLNNVENGGTRTISKLNCRNVSLWNNTTVTIRGIDPIGRILKTDDAVTSNDGRWEVYRTYGGNFVNAADTNSIQGRAVYSNAAGTVANEIGEAYSAELLQYSQDFDTVNVVEEGAYTEALLAYGFTTQTTTFTLADETDPLANTKIATLMFEDPVITERNASIVGQYTSAINANNFYDLANYFSFKSSDPEILSNTIVEASGSFIDLGDKDLIVDDTLDCALGYTAATGSIAATSTASLSTFCSGIRLYDTPTDPNFTILEASFNTVVPAANDYQLNNYQISENGTRLFAFGTSTSSDACNVIIEYTLSTPYDLSTATQTNTLSTGFINGQQGYGRVVDNGTKVIWSKRWGTWYQWDLSTPWDLSTAGARQNISFDARRTGFDFSDDGLKLFTGRDAQDTGNIYVYSYDLTVPFDISTKGSATEVNLTAAHGIISSFTGTVYQYHRPVRWLQGGNIMVLNDSVRGNFYTFEASTAYDPASLTLVHTLETGLDAYAGFDIIGPTNELHLQSTFAVNGTYDILSYELYQQLDFNGAANTIYVKSSNLSGTAQFDTIRTTGFVSTANGGSIGMSVIDANGSLTNVSVNGINPNTEVRMYRTSDDQEIAGLESSTGTSATLSYTFTTPEEYYIVVHNTEYTTSPRLIDFTTQSSPATLTVFQQLDRAFKNP